MVFQLMIIINIYGAILKLQVLPDMIQQKDLGILITLKDYH